MFSNGHYTLKGDDKMGILGLIERILALLPPLLIRVCVCVCACVGKVCACVCPCMYEGVSVCLHSCGTCTGAVYVSAP